MSIEYNEPIVRYYYRNDDLYKITFCDDGYNVIDTVHVFKNHIWKSLTGKNKNVQFFVNNQHKVFANINFEGAERK